MMPVPKSPVPPALTNVIFPREMGSPLYLIVPETSPVGKVRGPPEHPKETASPRAQVQTRQARHRSLTEPRVKGIVTSQAPLIMDSETGAVAGRDDKTEPQDAERIRLRGRHRRLAFV